MFRDFGHWGKVAARYLDVLANRSRDKYGKQHIAEFKGYVRKRICIVMPKLSLT